MEQAVEPLKPLKTWSHLATRRRKPTEYEVVSTNLHTNDRDPERPFELDPDVPIARWYKRYRHGSPLVHPDWNAFRDPDETIYRTYNIQQDGQETHVLTLFDQMADRGNDAMADPGWAPVLARMFAPARYLFHALQMHSAYLVQIMPSSTLCNCAVYQAGDHMRWVQHVAYRTRELANAFPNLGFGRDERRIWQDDPAWQGIRELIERGLATYDWGESFAVLNLVTKPLVEEAILGAWRQAARRQGDTLLPLLVDAQLADAARHRRWAGAAVRMMLEVESNRAVLEGWIARWLPLAHRASEQFCAAMPDCGAVPRDTDEAIGVFHRSMGLNTHTGAST